MGCQPSKKSELPATPDTISVAAMNSEEIFAPLNRTLFEDLVSDNYGQWKIFKLNKLPQR
jgi:hypothetical protein